jgi:hypothetical protein
MWAKGNELLSGAMTPTIYSREKPESCDTEIRHSPQPQWQADLICITLWCKVPFPTDTPYSSASAPHETHLSFVSILGALVDLLN